MNTNDYQTCVNLLKNKVFLGRYAGRHRVDEIDDFRDVINLHDTEEELKRDIDTLLNIVRNSRTSVWIALSDSSINGAYSLWVQLNGIAFGHYWFQIKHVRLTNKELFCVLSVIRTVPAQLVNPTFSFSQGFECAMRALRQATSGESCRGESNEADRNESKSARQQTEPNGGAENNSPRRNRESNTQTNEGKNRTQPESNPIGNARLFSFLKDFKGVTFDHIKASFTNEELRGGLIKTVLLCFFFTVISAMNLMYECLVIFTNIVVVTGDITIRVIHAVSRLIETISPLLLGVLNFVGKLATGLYILIAMVCGCTPYIPQQRMASPPGRQALMYR